ncbi:hypothetical protein [Paraburkholderia tropica]|uniref:hypothetical protein n=2 Tax=Paraburkholderia tropica TaxID=92647 RepID=UPI001FC82209|nr:hypothetical protein [Paraburkholderia tropica]
MRSRKIDVGRTQQREVDPCPTVVRIGRNGFFEKPIDLASLRIDKHQRDCKIVAKIWKRLVDCKRAAVWFDGIGMTIRELQGQSGGELRRRASGCETGRGQRNPQRGVGFGGILHLGGDADQRVVAEREQRGARIG